FVLAVSVERLLIIKFPFRSLDNYNSRQILLISLGILVATFVLTSWQRAVDPRKTSVKGEHYRLSRFVAGDTRRSEDQMMYSLRISPEIPHADRFNDLQLPDLAPTSVHYG
ncbi:hypothetical protein NECAME_18597, partial [Necator americanus]